MMILMVIALLGAGWLLGYACAEAMYLRKIINVHVENRDALLELLDGAANRNIDLIANYHEFAENLRKVRPSSNGVRG